MLYLSFNGGPRSSSFLLSSSQEDQIKDISDNLLEIGARIPGVRPGTATVAFLRDAQDTARFAGGRDRDDCVESNLD